MLGSRNTRLPTAMFSRRNPSNVEWIRELQRLWGIALRLVRKDSLCRLATYHVQGYLMTRASQAARGT